MIQIRRGVFETNSSSTHSITMCMKSEYELWKKGCLFYDGWNGTFIFKDEALQRLRENAKIIDPEELPEDVLLESLRDEEIYTFENYGDEFLESYTESFTTPSGETVIAFGQYGYDG